VLPRSHRDTARKAFEKVTKAALPASHRELARAIEREARAHEGQLAEIREQEHARAGAATTDEAGKEPDAEPIDDVDDGELGDEELDEPQAA
jgi:hypothetical protein